MPAKIYLHIGATKTGSSAFQKYCYINRDQLLHANVLYPDRGISSNAHHLFAAAFHPTANSLHKDELPLLDLEGRTALFLEILEGIVDDARRLKVGNVLISSEYFWDIFSDNFYEVWAHAFSKFVDAEIIAIIRKPDAWLQSWYSQMVKIGEHRDFEEWRQVFLPDASKGSNFLGVLEGWETTVGQDRLRLFDYEELLEHGDFCKGLLARLFGDNHAHQFDKLTEARNVENPSPRNKLLHLLLAVNRSDIEAETQNQIRQVLLRKGDTRLVGEEVTFISSEDRKKINDSYIPQLQTIRQRYSFG